MPACTSFSDAEKAKLLQCSAETLQQLQTESSDNEATTTTIPIRSWIQQTNLPTSASNRCRFFHTAGFVRVPAFCTKAECETMKARMAHLVQTQWQVEQQQQVDSFGTNDKENTARGDYFLESSDKVHFFAEPVALHQQQPAENEDDSGGCGVVLKKEYQQDKLAALNKAGHALHLPTKSKDSGNGDDDTNPFYDYCVSTKIRDLVLELGWKDPVVPQSMYIFKQAQLGGAVNSHQDSTFLYTTPKQSCLGLWLALDDATLDNGCLWVRPKSHHEAVRRQYKRNPVHFASPSSAAIDTDADAPKFLMEDLYEHDISWDGDLPEDLTKAGFIPIPCQAGDLLVFNGELDHLSLPNHSDQPRHTFQLHLVEGNGESVQWSPHNWLQYPEGKPFLRLLDDTPGKDLM